MVLYHSKNSKGEMIVFLGSESYLGSMGGLQMIWVTEMEAKVYVSSSEIKVHCFCRVLKEPKEVDKLALSVLTKNILILSCFFLM